MDGNEGMGQQVQALCYGLPVVPGTHPSMAHSSIYQACSPYSLGLSYNQRFQQRSYGNSSRGISFGAVMSGRDICSRQGLTFYPWLEHNDIQCTVTPKSSSFSSLKFRICQRIMAGK